MAFPQQKSFPRRLENKKALDDIPVSVRVVVLLSLEHAWNTNFLTFEEYEAATRSLTFNEVA